MNEFRQYERQDYTTDYLSDGARYRLPRRRLGRARHLGWVVLAAGLLLSLMMIAWMSGPVLGGLDDLRNGVGDGWFSIAFGGFGLFGLVPGLGLLVGGIAILGNRTRTEITVRGGTITIKERFLLARLRRKRPATGIRHLRVADASERTGDRQQPDLREWMGDFDTALLAETAGKRKFLIAAAYPRDLLVRLAEELAPRLEASVDITSAVIDREPHAIADRAPPRQKVDVVEGPLPREDAPVMIDQPSDSKATIERRDHGITIEIPPAGVWKGSKGMFAFALAWNAFMSIFIVVGILGAVGAIKVEGDGPPWLMLVIMLPFVAVGVTMAISAVNMGRRRATIATADDLVMVVRHSIFGKTTREFSADQIESIGCGNSGMEVNKVPIKELQIIPRLGNKFGCLSQLDNDELAWIAAELNQALGVRRGRPNGEFAAGDVNRDRSGLVTPAPNSRVTVEHAMNGIRINVPPKGLLRQLGLLLFGLVFAAAGVGIAIAVGGDSLRGKIDNGDISDLLFASIFLLGFGGTGCAIMLTALVVGRRQFRLTVEYNELTLLRRGPLFRKTYRWQRDDLESIDVIGTGTKVNNRTLYQVFIQSRKGNSIGIMTGHDSADLSLVATALQESLGLTPTEPASP